MTIANEVASTAKSDAGLGAQILFGVGQIAGQIFRDAPSLLLLFFMTNTLGVSPAIAGAAIFVPKFVWGAVCDLSVGAVSDGLSGRLPRRAWLLAGALLAPLAMILLFHVPAGAPNDKALYIAGIFSLYMLVFAIFSVPYLTIGAMLSSNTHGRTSVMVWRLVFTAVGILIASSGGPFLLQYWGGGEGAYRNLSIGLALVCAVSLIVAYFAASAAPRQAAPSAKPSLSALVTAVTTPRFVSLLGPVMLQLIGSGLSYASMLYFVIYNLGRTDGFAMLGILVLIMTAGIVAGQPLWLTLSKSIGKRATYLISTVGYGLSLGIWALLNASSPIWGSYLAAASLAVFNSGWALTSFSMLGDIIADDAGQKGQDRGGVFSAIWIAADKIGFALGGTLLVGLLLSAFNFNSAKAVIGAPQAESAHLGIAIAFGLAPLALNSLAFIWFLLAPSAKGRALQDS